MWVLLVGCIFFYATLSMIVSVTLLGLDIVASKVVFLLWCIQVVS